MDAPGIGYSPVLCVVQDGVFCLGMVDSWGTSLPGVTTGASFGETHSSWYRHAEPHGPRPMNPPSSMGASAISAGRSGTPLVMHRTSFRVPCARCAARVPYAAMLSPSSPSSPFSALPAVPPAPNRTRNCAGGPRRHPDSPRGCSDALQPSLSHRRERGGKAGEASPQRPRAHRGGAEQRQELYRATDLLLGAGRCCAINHTDLAKPRSVVRGSATRRVSRLLGSGAPVPSYAYPKRCFR